MPPWTDGMHITPAHAGQVCTFVGGRPSPAHPPNGVTRPDRFRQRGSVRGLTAGDVW